MAARAIGPRIGRSVCALLILGASALATPQPFGGHYYELILVADPYTGTNNTWETARDAAAASSFLGTPGHLATVSSAEENAFLVSLIPSLPPEFAGAWLGGTYPEGWLVGAEAGQAFGYTNFGGSEPNNNGLLYMNVGLSFAGIAQGKWVDDSGVQGQPDPVLDPVVGYFVEYDVPDPGCVGDINGDGKTNVADFNILASHFAQAVSPNTSGDLTGDGFVNVADFNILAGDFGCLP